MSPATAVSIPRRPCPSPGGGGGARVRILRRRRLERPAAEELGAVLRVRGVVARGFEGLELRAEVGELGAKVADALVGFFLLGGDGFLLGEGVVFVDGAGEGGEGGREGADGGGGEGRGGGGEGGEVAADEGALFESRVEGCVLGGEGGLAGVGWDGREGRGPTMVGGEAGAFVWGVCFLGRFEARWLWWSRSWLLLRWLWCWWSRTSRKWSRCQIWG